MEHVWFESFQKQSMMFLGPQRQPVLLAHGLIKSAQLQMLLTIVFKAESLAQK